MSEVAQAEVVEAEWFEESPRREQEKPVPIQGSNLSRAEKRQEELKSLEDEMLASCLEVVGGSIDFVELDPDDPVKPEGWSDRKYRAALAGLKNAKESPVGLKVATQFAVGAIRAKAVERAGPRSMNVTMVQFAAPRKAYDEVEVDD